MPVTLSGWLLLRKGRTYSKRNYLDHRSELFSYIERCSPHPKCTFNKNQYSWGIQEPDFFRVSHWLTGNFIFNFENVHDSCFVISIDGWHPFKCITLGVWWSCSVFFNLVLKITHIYPFLELLAYMITNECQLEAFEKNSIWEAKNSLLHM